MWITPWWNVLFQLILFRNCESLFSPTFSIFNDVPCVRSPSSLAIIRAEKRRGTSSQGGRSMDYDICVFLVGGNGDALHIQRNFWTAEFTFDSILENTAGSLWTDIWVKEKERHLSGHKLQVSIPCKSWDHRLHSLWTYMKSCYYYHLRRYNRLWL